MKRVVPLVLLMFGMHVPSWAETRMTSEGFFTLGTISATTGKFASNIGVGTQSPLTPMHVMGTVRVQNDSMTCHIGTGLGILTCVSDERLKTDIQPITGALEKLSHVRGVTYRWKDPKAKQDLQMGVIAQEIKAQFPQAVERIDSTTLAVDYPKLVAPLIQAVNELHLQNKALQKDLKILRDQLNAMQTQSSR